MRRDRIAGDHAMPCRCMRITLTLTAIACLARPAASFASLPGSAMPVDVYAAALVEVMLTDCSASERNEHGKGVERAAADLAGETDQDGDGLISTGEIAARRESTDAKTIAVAEAVEDELPTDQCLLIPILDKMAETTPGTSNPGRMLEARQEHQRRLETSAYQKYGGAMDVMPFLLYRACNRACLISHTPPDHGPLDGTNSGVSEECMKECGRIYSLIFTLSSL